MSSGIEVIFTIFVVFKDEEVMYVDSVQSMCTPFLFKLVEIFIYPMRNFNSYCNADIGNNDQKD